LRHGGLYARSPLGMDMQSVSPLENLQHIFPARHRARVLGHEEIGERAVARALMSRPAVLLMDEPSLGLAPLVVSEIFDIIAELNRDGTTIFLVEQNAHMALKVAHQFFLMEQGRITFRGTPGELAEDEVIQRAYLGTRRAG
jgi:ABC-type branched-subunit amino acid transport system ATPase component